MLHAMADHDAMSESDGGNGGGGLTRESFTRAVINRVREKFPLVKIGRAKHSFCVRVNGQVVSLENLYRGCQFAPDDMQRQVERWTVELLRAGEGRPDREAGLDEVRDRVLPMLLPGGKTEGAVGGIDVNGQSQRDDWPRHPPARAGPQRRLRHRRRPHDRLHPAGRRWTAGTSTSTSSTRWRWRT